MKYTKQIFVHNVSGGICWQVTPFLIYSFASLQMVAFYTNYTTITQKLGFLLTHFLGGTSAGVGNLIAEGNKTKILDVYWELITLRFFFSSIAVFALYYLLPPFIALWLGFEYIMSENVLILVLISFFMNVIRGTTDEFINGYGLFSDIWAPLIESLILVVVAIVGGYLWGLEGVLLGGVVSTGLIVCGWKPYFLFSRGFKLSVRFYWIEFCKYLLGLIIAFVLSIYMLGIIRGKFNIYESWIDWILYAIIVSFIISSCYFIYLLLFTGGMKNLAKRLIHLV